MAHMLELFPFLGEVKVLRQWAGMADMTPDFSPIMGLDAASRTTTSTPAGAPGASRRRRSAASAWPSASPPASQPALLEPFALDRFERFALVGEKGAASVGH